MPMKSIDVVGFNLDGDSGRDVGLALVAVGDRVLRQGEDAGVEILPDALGAVRRRQAQPQRRRRGRLDQYGQQPGREQQHCGRADRSRRHNPYSTGRFVHFFRCSLNSAAFARMHRISSWIWLITPLRFLITGS